MGQGRDSHCFCTMPLGGLQVCLQESETSEKCPSQSQNVTLMGKEGKVVRYQGEQVHRAW